MKIVHISNGWEKWNGAANIARMIGGGQSAAGHEVSYGRFPPPAELRAADEVWIHCGWTPCLWRAALIAGKKAKWMPECCYDPVRRRYHGWKKFLAGPVERFCLRRCKAIVATCEAEAEWIRGYLGERCPPVEIEDIKRFFKLPAAADRAIGREDHRPLHVLYLGRRHPLKGVGYLERAAAEAGGVELRVVSNAFGDEKERVWAWADVLCLPTLSDNFGLVVAEALERGKRAITTDGAPAWGDGNTYGGRLAYLEGYRDGGAEKRVGLLRDALAALARQTRADAPAACLPGPG